MMWHGMKVETIFALHKQGRQKKKIKKTARGMECKLKPILHWQMQGELKKKNCFCKAKSKKYL